MPMNPRILRPLARPLLLDAVPGAAAAYSLRQLSNAYTGPVVTVRRSSDNAEADFKASEIDDGTLTAFCGAGDGLVKTWFDQSGNGRDASQGTAGYQPKIVSSGSLVTEGGKAALEFDGTDDRLPANAVASVITGEDVAHSRVVVCSPTSTAEMHPFGFGRSVSNTPLNTVAFAPNGQIIVNVRDNAGTEKFGYRGYYSLAQTILFYATTGTAGFVALNGATTATLDVNVGSITLDTATVGAFIRIAAGGFFDGTISELIIYPSDQSANRERIEGDLAWYY